MSVASTFLIILFVFLFISTANSLRCKCTQSSNKSPCEDGVCDVYQGACLMLDHPENGKLYACSSNSLLSEGVCDERKSKSGFSVKYCSCKQKDFCNYEKWPDRQDLDYGFDENRSSTLDTGIFLTLLVSTGFLLFTGRI